jgi:predicted nuclease of predicted toxin-antitoxin system
VRLLLDEMYPPAAAVALRDRGIDAIAVKELREVAGMDDASLLSWAHEQERVVVTENIPDFARLASNQDHCGIVMCPQTRYARTASNIGKLVEALATLADDPPHDLGIHPVVCWL